MKILVTYTSKYGSTEKYARWIAESLGCAAKKLSDVSAGDLKDCDTIVYGGGLYAGRIAGFKQFLAKLGAADEKRLVLYLVGMTNPKNADAYAEVADKNVPPQWKGKFSIFYLQGDLQFSNMSFFHKLMMRVPKTIAEKKPPEKRTEDDKQFLESFGRDVFLSKSEAIAPLINCIKAEK